MANKQNNIFKYLFVPLLVAVCLAALSLWLYFGYFNDDGSSKRPFAPPSILISSASHSATFGERGYIGASLVYDDGTVEDGVFSYSSDDPLLTFPDSSSGYFVVGSADSASPDFALGDSVTVTVSCTDIEDVEPVELKIAICGEETTVRFEYYSDFSGELKSEAVSVSDGSPTGLPEGFADDALAPYIFGGWYVVGEDGQCTDEVFYADRPLFSENWSDNGGDALVTVRAVYYVENLLLSCDGVGDGQNDMVVEDKIYYGRPLEARFDEAEDAEGWTFGGWFTERGGEGDYLDEDGNFVAAFDGEPVLYAKWSSAVELRNVFGYKAGTSSEALQVTYNSVPDYPAPEYSNGGGFSRWYYLEDNQRKYVEQSERFTLPASTVLYAEIAFPVELDWQGATPSGGDIAVVYGLSFEQSGAKLPTIEKENGWNFAGWYSDNGSFIHQFDVDEVYSVAGPLKLYAKRTSTLTFNVQLNQNGEPDSSAISVPVVYNGAVDLSEFEGIAAEGWVFGGWYAEQGGGGQALDAESYTAEGGAAYYAKWSAQIALDSVFESNAPAAMTVVYNSVPDYPAPEYSNGGSFSRWYYLVDNQRKYVAETGRFTLPAGTALHAEVTFPVELDWQGATPAAEKIDLVYGLSLEEAGIVLPVPKEDIENNWQFIGWFTQAAGEGSAVVGTSTDEAASTEVDEALLNSIYSSAEGVYKLFAKRVTYFILYEELSSDGTPVSGESVEEVVYNGKFTYTVAAEGWTFGGWFTESGGKGQKFDSEAVYTGEGCITLHAKWSATVGLDNMFSYKQGTSAESLSVVYNGSVMYNDGVEGYPRPAYSYGGTFEGWYIAVGNERSYIDTEAPFTLPSSVKITNLILEAEVSFPVVLKDMGEQTDDNIKIIYGLSLDSSGGSLPVPVERDGWTFEGWYTAEGGGGTKYLTTMEWRTAGTLYLYAKRTSQLTFFGELDALGQPTGQSTIVNVTYGAVPALPASYQPEGWTFGGWFTERGGEGDHLDAGAAYKGAAQAELYAKWTGTVSLSLTLPLRATLAQNTFKVVYNGVVMGLPQPEYFYDGEAFGGWYTSLYGNGTAIGEGQPYACASLQLYDAVSLSYTLDFNGSGAQGEERSIIYGSEMLARLPEPELEGWNFDGWFTEEGKQLVFRSQYVFEGDTVFYAKWRGVVTLEKVVDIDCPATLDIYYGVFSQNGDTLPALDTWGTWDFTGWYTEAAGRGEKVTDIKLVNGDCTLYACWRVEDVKFGEDDETRDLVYGLTIAEANDGKGLPAITGTPPEGFTDASGWYVGSVRLTDNMTIFPKEIPNRSVNVMWAPKFSIVSFYDNDGATLIVGNVQIDYADEKVKIIAPQPKKGYIFLGYYLLDGEEIKYFSYSGGENAVLDKPWDMVATHVTMCARWQKESYNLIFDADGGIAGEESMVVDYGGALTLPEAARDGHCFLGWTFGEAPLENGVVGDLGDYAAGYDGKPIDIIVKAQWLKESYAITFDYNGGSGGEEELVVGYGDDAAALPSAEREGYYFIGWQTADGVLISDLIPDLGNWSGDASSPIPVELSASWMIEKYDVTFISDKGDIAQTPVTVTYNSVYDLPEPSHAGYVFVGWQFEEVLLKGKVSIPDLGDSADGDTIAVTANAVWEYVDYTVTFDGNGGECSVEPVTNMHIDCPVVTPLVGQTPTRLGYTFTGFYDENGVQYYDAALESVRDWDKPSGATLKAGWEVIAIYLSNSNIPSSTITISDSQTGISFKVEGGSGSYNVVVSSTSHLNLTYTQPASDGTCKITVSKKENSKSGSFTITIRDTVTDYKIEKIVKYQTTGGGGCFAAGSMITLADGSAIPVEKLKVGDQIMVFDHFSGTLTSSPVAYIFHGGVEAYRVLTLHFSDGTEVDVLFAHGFFDEQLNRYVQISCENVQSFVGHNFCKISSDGEISWVTLESYEIAYSLTDCYSVLSAAHIDHVVNGMLAVTDDIDGLYNVFDYGDGMKYDEEAVAEDIAKYGLFTYEEWEEYVTYEQFMAFGGPYLKVAVGKGLITYEQIFALIEQFLR